jgi:hypothetical protein
MYLFIRLIFTVSEGSPYTRYDCTLFAAGLYTHKKEDQIFLIFSGISEWSSCEVIFEEGLSYMRKCANISPYMRRPLVIYDFATAPF